MTFPAPARPSMAMRRGVRPRLRTLRPSDASVTTTQGGRELPSSKMMDPLVSAGRTVTNVAVDTARQVVHAARRGSALRGRGQDVVVDIDEARATAEALLLDRGVELSEVHVLGPDERSVRALDGEQTVWVFTFQDRRQGRPRGWPPHGLRVAVSKDGTWADLLR